MTARQMRYGAIGTIVHRTAVFLASAIVAGPATAMSVAPVRLVWALGDSLTAGYGLPPADGFPVQLERALLRSGVPAAVRNGGIAGDTAAQARARLAWGLRGLGRTPDLVIVEVGANDMLRGLPAAGMARNLDLILAELRRRHIPVLIAGMKAAPNLGRDYARGFEGAYPALARKYGYPLYPFFLDGVAGQPVLIQADGRHPNAEGVRRIVARMLPAVRKALRD